MSKIGLQRLRAHRWLGIAEALLFVSVAYTGVALPMTWLPQLDTERNAPSVDRSSNANGFDFVAASSPEVA